MSPLGLQLVEAGCCAVQARWDLSSLCEAVLYLLEILVIKGTDAQAAENKSEEIVRWCQLLKMSFSHISGEKTYVSVWVCVVSNSSCYILKDYCISCCFIVPSSLPVLHYYRTSISEPSLHIFLHTFDSPFGNYFSYFGFAGFFLPFFFHWRTFR